MRIRFSIYLAAFVLVVSSGFSYEIKPENLKETVYYLADDKLEGRKPGTPGDEAAQAYILSKFKEYGLKPLFDDGRQFFEVVEKIEVGEKSRMFVDGQAGETDKDFVPMPFTKNAAAFGKAVFAGYGMVIDDEDLKRNDYEGIDPAGKWVIVLRGDPDNAEEKSRFDAHNQPRQKALTARDKGAIGIIFVTGKNLSEKDETIAIAYDKSPGNVGIPALNATRAYIDKAFEQAGTTVDRLEAKLDKTGEPVALEIDAEIDAEAEAVKVKSKTANIAAMIEGSEIPYEYIVIGAHHDHLGYGGPGSGSRRPDTIAIHNGADDNASGVAAVLEIARTISNMPTKPKRSFIFATFGAEESGIQGSKYFVENPPVDIDKIKFMINLDLVGRLDEETNALSIGGTGTAEGIEDILNKSNDAELKLTFSPEGYGPSDHSSFYLHDKSVLFFFAGADEDYHTPFDDADKLNYSGLARITQVATNTAIAIANLDENLAFKEAGPKRRQSFRRNFKVTLGIMPDHTGGDIKGLRADLVIPGKPAAMAGMQKGDVIVALDGKPVGDIYEYMHRLSELEPGRQITVDVIRDGKKKVLIVNL